LAVASANLVVIADPTTYVLSGLTASAADPLREQAQLEIRPRLLDRIKRALSIVPAGPGGDALALGATRLAPLAPV
jgi:hypothetical protein